MFKQITREEYLALADAGVQVSAWAYASDLEDYIHTDPETDDAKHSTYVVREVREGDPHWKVFYAWVDDEEDADVQP